MIYIGIDIGAKGAMAIFKNNDLIDIIDYNINDYIVNIKRYKEFFGINNIKCCIEKVHSHPKQGVVSTFTFGEKYGEIKGILSALNIRYTEVNPKVWQNYLGIISGSGKKGIYNKIIDLYPDWKNILIGSRGGIKDGRCDAVGITRFCKLYN